MSATTPSTSKGIVKQLEDLMDKFDTLADKYETLKQEYSDLRKQYSIASKVIDGLIRWKDLYHSQKEELERMKSAQAAQEKDMERLRGRYDALNDSIIREPVEPLQKKKYARAEDNTVAGDTKEQIDRRDDLPLFQHTKKPATSAPKPAPKRASKVAETVVSVKQVPDYEESVGGDTSDAAEKIPSLSRTKSTMQKE